MLCTRVFRPVLPLLVLLTGVEIVRAEKSVAADSLETNLSGLQFVSHYAIKDDRTSLDLTPDKPLNLRGDFSLDFDVRFSSAMYTFGYVFRLILDGQTNFDMISDMSSGAHVDFIHGDQSVAEFLPSEEVPGFGYDRWIPVSIRTDHARDSIVLTFGGVEKRIAAALESSRAELWFGACYHDEFYTTDVPLIAVRDIRILDEHDKPLRYWKLGRHAGNMVYDETDRHPARTVNPIWLIDNYARWEKRLSETVPQGYLQVAADPDSGKLYFAGERYVGVYDNSSPAAALEQLAVKNRMPFTPEANQMLFDPVRRRLTVYEYETRSLSVLDPGSLQWSATDSVRPIPRYWHHDSAFLPGTNRFATFGGYGEHTYKSLLTVVETDEAGRAIWWKSVDLSEKLPPRYLSGMVADRQGKLLVIGGYGSPTGLQSEGPHNFYDMYRIDPSDGSVESLGELQRQDVEKHFVLGRDMVLSPDEKTVYALAYSDKRYASQIALIGIEWETGKATPYADYVPYEFSDIESFCTLVHDRKRNELLLIETRLTGENQTRVEISALKYPPLSFADTTQPERDGGTMWWLGGGVLLLLLTAAGGFLLRRRKSRTPAPAQPEAVPEPVKTETTDYHKIYRVEKRPSSILLLGGFQVVDKKGKDITGSFTQIVRTLFLLIMLDTYKNGRGISSQELRDILWFDKDSENARNNRNVNMHKLRTLLQQVGEVDISGENSYWHLELQSSVFCDYSMLLQICREVEESRDSDPEALDTLVRLASLGKLLPNIQTDWIDAYKSEFSIRLIEHLMRISGYKSVRENPQMLFRIAEAILVHDNLDEDAIRIKCTALVQMGKKNQAKQVYEAFVGEFRKALDSDPDFNLTNILK